MNQDDIIKLAREAGMPPVEITSDKPVLYPLPDAIERFATLVVAAERERIIAANAPEIEKVNAYLKRKEALLRQALEALESLQGGCTDSDDGTVEAITVWCPEVIDALRAALAEPVQPVATVRTWHKNSDQHAELWDWMSGIASLPDGEHTLYAAPQQRLPLTDEEISSLWENHIVPVFGKNGINPIVFARAIEQAHGIKEKT